MSVTSWSAEAGHDPVEAVGDGRARQGSARVVRPVHCSRQIEQLRASPEEPASDAPPPSVSKRYSLSTLTHGTSWRRRASSSLAG